jgi:hypothetical protein
MKVRAARALDAIGFDDLTRIADAVKQELAENNFCTYMGHNDDRGEVDPECPGTFCFLSMAVDPTGGAPKLSVVDSDLLS